MKRIMLLYMAPLLFLSAHTYAQESNKAVVIRGKLKGLNQDSVVMFCRNYNPETAEMKMDTFYFERRGDSVYFNGTADKSMDAFAVVGGFRGQKNFNFYYQPGDIRIDGDLADTEKISVTGTPDNDDLTRHSILEASIYDLNEPLMERLKLVTDTESAEAKALRKSIADNRDSVQKVRHRFIAEHPSSLASLLFLRVLEDKISLPEFEQLYNAFTPRLKETLFGQQLQEKITARRRTVLGSNAPMFTSTTVDGKKVNLEDYKGKYVLLEFWASWCVPCRQESPHLVKMYTKYQPKGFTILQYSIDEKSAEAKWKEAIKKDKLVWTQISDLMGFNSPVSKLYGVQPIPDNFLIDPSGKIIARRLRGQGLEDKLSELFDDK